MPTLPLPYVEQGDPSGVPVVLLHGYTDSWRSFELVVPHLPDSIHAFAVTQRGHGDAERPADGYGASELTADLVAFMDSAGVERAVIAGHSAGSYTAQRLAVDHPERVLGTVLIGAVRSLHDNPGVAELLEAVSALSDPIDPAFVRELQESTLHQPVPASFLEMVVAESAKLPARVWQAALRGLVDADVPTSIGTVSVPTLMLWGDRDELCSLGEQEALVAVIPGSRLVVYPDTGHALHWERPERAAADLVAFASEVGRS